MTNIILCGGSGTRLWPISRTLMPKQFIKIFDGKSLFQLTVERNKKLCRDQLIVSNSEQYFLAVDQIDELNSNLKNKNQNFKFLLEPIGRNTAPAIALACMACDGDEIVFVSPSDHLVKNEIEYAKVADKAKKLAKDNALVTFGIKPKSAETGFGYMEVDGEEVIAFHEKPDYEIASSYFEAGNYYWNSGMFMFKARVYLDELKKYAPDIYDNALKAFKNATIDNELIWVKHQGMIAIPEDSIDYAIMEKSAKVKVVIADIEWNDVGSFEALYEVLPKDKNGNTKNDSYTSIGSKNNFIYGDFRKIATIDIENLIIVDTADALLISKKGSSQKVKQVVAEIKKDSQLHNIHLTAHRPWGIYTVLEDK